MNDVRKNDLRGCEAMLYSQAHALHAIFVDLSVQARKQEWFANVEALMRMAFKSQNQCRATLETLATIKNPQPVAFVRQANIAHGQSAGEQRDDASGRASRARKKRKYAKPTIGRETA